MTVVAAMRDGDGSVLIGADSGESHSDGTTMVYRHKLRKHPTMPLAWAAAGDGEIGRRFAVWLEAQNLAAYGSWDGVAERCGDILSRLNGAARERAAAARATIGPNTTADVLLVGWIAGQSGIYEINNEGTISAYTAHDGLYAIGKGGEARAAYLALLAAGCAASLDRFRMAVETVAGHFQMCALPVHIWRLTRDSSGIEIVLGDGPEDSNGKSGQ